MVIGLFMCVLLVAPAASASSGAWTLTGSAQDARWMHTATLLASGKVLIAGGYEGSSTSTILATAERRGLYSSHLVDWRRQRDAGALRALGRKRAGVRRTAWIVRCPACAETTSA